MLQLLKLSEVGTELRIAPRTVRRLVRDGQLPVVRLTRRSLRIRRQDLDRYLRARRVPGADDAA